jgi:hypothetical protein
MEFRKIDLLGDDEAVIIPKAKAKNFKEAVLRNGMNGLETVEYSGHKGFLVKNWDLKEKLTQFPQYFDYIGSLASITVSLDKLTGANVKTFKSIIDLSDKTKTVEAPGVTVKTIFDDMQTAEIKKYLTDNEVELSYAANIGKDKLIKLILENFPEQYLAEGQ